MVGVILGGPEGCGRGERTPRRPPWPVHTELSMLKSLLTCAGLAAALCATSAPASAQNLTTTRVAAGLSGSLYVTSPPGDADRLFVVRQSGQIRIIDNLQTSPVVLATPFLTITGIPTSGERGLLGLAFHPDYANNGRFFVNYTASGGGSGGQTVVQEYAVSTTDPNVANPTPVQTIVTVNQDFTNHNGGCIQFGPDGKLYVGMGDGGSGGDPNNRAQTMTSRLGKMLRFDVDIASPFIPADNPFVGVAGSDDAIWASGIRNPWRFSFDRLTGDMYMGDVGQNAWEEINFQPASSTGGEDYGWRCKEGNSCFNNSTTGCSCSDTTLTDPIQVYSHSLGFSITGGYVYRGTRIPSLDGVYFYADFGSNRIWSFRYDGSTLTEFTERTSQLDPPTGSISNIASFGEDANGELYIVELGGEIWRIDQDCDVTNYCTALPNSTGSISNLSFSGSLAVQDNNFNLIATSIPQGQFAYIIGGTERGFVSMPGTSQGNLCVGGTLLRFNMPSQVGQPDFLGIFTVQLDLTQFPANPTVAVQAGETWRFQCWHRENGGSSNFSNGLEALFCP